MTDIVSLLLAERSKIDAAIAALGASPQKRRGRPPGSKNGQRATPAVTVADAIINHTHSKKARRGFTAAQRKAASLRMKKRWAEKRKAAAKKK